uniref:Uncharacterized protein n=1 Tax=Oryza barthii TaxID=65489 RepID=A0A679BC99_9ORYZ|nr:hypothetical protein [Oryza barthii]
MSTGVADKGTGGRNRGCADDLMTRGSSTGDLDDYRNGILGGATGGLPLSRGSGGGGGGWIWGR